MTDNMVAAADTLITLTADIVSAHLANNSVPLSDVAGLIAQVHGALAGLGSAPIPPQEELKPAVSIRASIKPDHLVCLEDGKKLKMLKRHLMTHFQMTPEDYRAKWKLPADYPMVAPDYAAQRSELAISIGLGRKPKAVEIKPVKAPRKKAAPKT